MPLNRPDTAPTKRQEAIISRQDVENLIAEGRTILIVDGYALKVDAWLRYHPGGDKAIKHMVGRDATDEVNAARQFMNKFRIGRIEGRWKNLLPPIQGGKFRRAVPIDEYKEANGYEQDHSSRSSSRSTSPIFDTLGLSDRLRGPGMPRTSAAGETSSVSSMASEPSLDKDAGENQTLSHLDIYTREAIDLDKIKYPSLDPATQDEIVRKYRLLYSRIVSERLFDCNYFAYFVESCRYMFLFLVFIFTLRAQWFAISGFSLGLLWHQLVFTVHDAGHMGITHGFQTDTIIGIMIADFIGGLSLGWWKRNHNVHHIVTNSPEHDPDIEHMPFFAISHRFFDSLRSTYYERIMAYDIVAKFTIQYQHFLYYPILLFGRFNLYRLSWEFLLKGQGPKKGPARWHRWLEITGQIVFWYWYGYLVLYKAIPTVTSRLIFILISHMVTAPLHVQITLSHFAMSTADLGVDESFPQKMLRTTMDVDCPTWLDFVHGGLQHQAIHHLFPRIPRHNLRRTQKLVQTFCEDVGIPYALYGFVDGNKEVIGRLADVARQAKILAECKNSITSEGLLASH